MRLNELRATTNNSSAVEQMQNQHELIDEKTLSDDQRAVFTDIENKRNVLITGPAGTGKSYLLRFLKQRYPALVVTASTGIAAINVQGRTIHSWAGLGLGKRTPQAIANKIVENNAMAYRLRNTHMLAIEEISMVSANLLDTLDIVLQLVRENDFPFGGMQLIFLGDFLQLPPVDKDEVTTYAFESNAWQNAGVKVHVLNKIFRQENEEFAQALNRIRVGKITKKDLKLIKGRVGMYNKSLETRPVVLHSVNRKVDEHNNKKLGELDGDPVTFMSNDYAQYPNYESLLDSCLAPRVLQLKPKAQVMLIRNLDLEGKLANGSVGEVVSVESGKIVVKFYSCKDPVEVDQVTWEVKNDKDVVIASRTQYPLKLAWSFSIHKSQGMTIDHLYISMRNMFAYGQGYVALSRAKYIETLYLDRFDLACIQTCPKALKFYNDNT